ncbi:hypothetical protein H4219_001432 [Mycoemilia scoparia]|uniref:Uncharacterized protein n=1 Tax=Mycoemilia scoparia TaxID=417184 RepID=A0A9W8A6S0_9FUNG|nr:hypothetical protein H4219_001432 [Mycoemilia scoparia]
MMGEYSPTLPKPLGLASDPKMAEQLQFLRKAYGVNPTKNGDNGGYTYLNHGHLQEAAAHLSAPARTPNSMAAQNSSAESPHDIVSPQPVTQTTGLERTKGSKDFKPSRERKYTHSPLKDVPKLDCLKTILEELESNRPKKLSTMQNLPSYTEIIRKHTLSSQMLSAGVIEKQLKTMTSLIPDHFSITLPLIKQEKKHAVSSKQRILSKSELPPIPEVSKEPRPKAEKRPGDQKPIRPSKSIKLESKEEKAPEKKNLRISIPKTKKRQLLELLAVAEKHTHDDSMGTMESAKDKGKGYNSSSKVVSDKSSPKRSRQHKDQEKHKTEDSRSSRTADTAKTHHQESESTSEPRSHRQERQSPYGDTRNSRSSQRSRSRGNRNSYSSSRSPRWTSDKATWGSDDRHSSSRQRTSTKAMSSRNRDSDSALGNDSRSHHHRSEAPSAGELSRQNSISARQSETKDIVRPPTEYDYDPDVIEYCRNQFNQITNLGRKYKHKADRINSPNKIIRIAHYIEASCCFCQAFWHGDSFKTIRERIADWKSVTHILQYTLNECEGSSEIHIYGAVAKLYSAVQYHLSVLYTELAKTFLSNRDSDKSRPNGSTAAVSSGSGSGISQSDSPITSITDCFNEMDMSVKLAKEWFERSETKLPIAELMQNFRFTWHRCTIGVMRANPSVRLSFTLPDEFEPREAIEYIEGTQSNRGFDALPNRPLVYPITSMTNILDVVAFSRFITRELIDRRGLTNSLRLN